MEGRTAPIRIIMADDHPVLRAGLRALVESEPGMTVVQEIARGEDVIPQVQARWPDFDLLILDARMPNFDPVTTVGELTAALPEVRVLILSSYDDPEYVLGLLNAGARGYVLKDEPRATLLSAVRIVADGDMYMSPKVATVYVRRQRTLASDRDRLLTLTDREREVLGLVGSGYDNQEIGDRLKISYETVKNHLRSIYGKLSVANRYQRLCLRFATT